MKKIAIVIGDAATGDFVLPVLPFLDREGIRWQIFVDPGRQAAGANTLRKQNIPYVEAETLPDPMSWDMVICGTAAKSQTLVRNATLSALSAKKEVVWVGDFYGSGCEKEMLDLAPDWITALDGTAVEQIRCARPDYPADRIRLIGNPAWDRIPDIMADRSALRGEIFARLAFPRNAKFIVVACSDTAQFAEQEMLDIIEAMCEYCDRHHAFAFFLFHPADQQKDLWKAKINRLPLFIQMPDKLTGDTLVDLMLADVAVVQYSQVGCQAALARPTLFTLFPSIRRYLAGRRHSWSGRFFPQIFHHAAEVAWDAREIAPALDRMLGDEPGYHKALDEARRQHFSTLMDGHAVERFMGLVRERLLYSGSRDRKEGLGGCLPS